MSRLSYLYLREFLDPNEHIYFYVSASPIGVEYLTEFFDEPFELLAENEFLINRDVKIHVKQATTLVDVESGVNRRILDFLRAAYFNKENYLAVDADQLIAHDIVKDFKGVDFGARYISMFDRSCWSCIAYIRNGRLTESFGSEESFIDYLNAIESFHARSKIQNMVICGEGGYFRKFCYGNVRQVSFPEKTIHDCSRAELLSFIEKTPIRHPFLTTFLAAASGNTSLL